MKTIGLLSLIILLTMGCSQSIHSENLSEQDYPTDNKMLVLGKKLENPYSLANMQRAYSEVSLTKSTGNITLEATLRSGHFLPICLHTL